MRLADLLKEERLEITCRACGKTRYEAPRALLATLPDADTLYLDEVEADFAARIACA